MAFTATPEITVINGDIPNRRFHMADESGNIKLRGGDPILAEDAVRNDYVEDVERERAAILALAKTKGTRKLHEIWFREF